MAGREYIVFSDESEKKGKYFSNFYGGVLVSASHYQRVTERIEARKRELNLLAEVKRSKVTERYLEKYEALMRSFFQEMRDGHVKVRIMFTQNFHQAVGLTAEDHDMGYFKLYYQFIKHAFGFRFIEPVSAGTRLRLYFDQFPDTREKIEQFKGYLLALQSSPDFRKANLTVRKEDITEVRSHDHVLPQCLDIVLGSMAFRLNDRHKVIPAGKRCRGKKTRAKEALYKAMLQEIRFWHPGFNVGISTGKRGNPRAYWEDAYRHWLFVPKENVRAWDRTKRREQKTKRDPT